jgi:F-type H+-transporting ATPase subunit gamma
MANLRDIRNRIESVENTKQVTRAMKMVAAAKLRKAQERIFQTRPYAYKIREMLENLKGELDPTAHPLFQEPEDAEGMLVIVVTADRGLCGAFNSNVIEKAEGVVEEHAHLQEQDNLFLLAIGEKGHNHFQKRNHRLVGDYRGIFDDLSYSVAEEVIEDAVEGFRRGIWSEVKIVYNEFKNTIVQNQIAEPLLPIPEERFQTPVMEEEMDMAASLPENGQAVDYIFEPDPSRLLDELVPRFLYYQMWKALLESNASEQGARMVAMDNATENAEEMIEDLTLEYNRARQNAITMELLDIASGAEALDES